MDPKEIEERADYYFNALTEIDDRMREEAARASAIARREQRRYELARDVMAALWVDGPHWGQWAPEDAVEKKFAREAVKASDALLAELERTDALLAELERTDGE